MPSSLEMFSRLNFFKTDTLFFSPDKLAPDACPRAKNRKRFDPTKSGALAVLLDHEQGTFHPKIETPLIEEPTTDPSRST